MAVQSRADFFFIPLAAIVGLSLPVATLAGKYCSPTAQPGCETSYSCVSWTTYACTSGFGQMSQAKNGEMVPFHICVTGEGTCDEVQVLCHIDNYFRNSNCTTYCNDYKRYTTGCIDPIE